MPTPLRIRPYLEQDEPQVVALWETVFPNNPAWNVPVEDIRRKLLVQRDLFLVGELDGQVIATVMAGFDGHRGWIHRLAVLPPHRHHGIGRQIMAAAETRLAAIGCTKVNLQVRATNQPVLSFYDRIGYIVEDLFNLGKRLAPVSITAPSPAAAVHLAVSDVVHLSEIRPADTAAFVEFLNDHEIYERTLRIPAPYTAADADRFLAEVAMATAAHGHPVHFAVRDNTARLIGCCSFENLVYGHRCGLGYWLARPYWGRGIMTQVVRTACAFAMAEWKLVRIAADVFDFNTASARVLEKNGFQCEGTLRKQHRKDGRFLDARLYALVTPSV